MSFKNKTELVEFIKKQTNIELSNKADDTLNKKRNIFYTEISRQNKNIVLGLMNKYGITYEEHINNRYFVFVR